MPTSIAFTDAEGAVTLTNSKPVPGDRLASWTPLVRSVGPEGGHPVGLGNGIIYGWEHRLDFGVRFSLEHIPQASLRNVIRLMHWLIRGAYSPASTEGVVTLTPGDVAGNVYTCRLWPGSEPQLEPMDRSFIEHRLTLELLNTDAEIMACGYDVAVS